MLRAPVGAGAKGDYTMEASREPTVICKPALDHREYCHLRLGPRGELTAVLISDPEPDKAAAAMDVVLYVLLARHNMYVRNRVQELDIGP